ncbi:MAG: hypothetical protein ACRCS7_07375 [Tannerellaceae bacterium]
MKKLLFAIALVSGIGFTTNAALTPAQSVILSTVMDTEEYTVIEITEVPKAVTDAVAKKHEGSTIKKAAVDKETMIYQITAETTEGKEVVSLFKETGEEVIEPAAATPAEPTTPAEPATPAE